MPRCVPRELLRGAPPTRKSSAHFGHRGGPPQWNHPSGSTEKERVISGIVTFVLLENGMDGMKGVLLGRKRTELKGIEGLTTVGATCWILFFLGLFVS